MKRLVLIMSIMVMVMGMQTSAIASEWIISPSGEVDVTGQDQVSFDIIFDNTTDGWFPTATWDVNLWLDVDEFTPHFNPDNPTPPDFIPYGYSVVYSYEDTSGHSFGGGPLDMGRFLSDNVFMIAGLAFTDVWIAPGENTMATVTFDILNPDAPNGSVEADILVLAQDPLLYKGFTQGDDDVIYVDTDSTINADIVSAVPIPAAVWLLGSGLMGLIGIRRKSC